MNYDIAIIGNGLAANLFARHLLLIDKNLKIIIIGPKETPKYTVGESVTELASHYLQHRLKLTSYLYRNQLFKNGLRFFYDNEEKNLHITQMSEDGIGRFLNFNTFHLDRYAIENDLKRMNGKQGIKYIDSSVADVIFSSDENIIITSYGKKNGTIKAKWVIDGSGMKRFLANKLKMTKDVKKNFHCAVWGHFKAINNIDSLSNEWRRKNLFTTREFSTIHFTYPNYWIWVIPLKDNVISCGVVYDGRYLFKDGSPNEKQFLSFLDSHKALNELFEKGALLNFKAVRNYSYSSEQFISEKRFALIGDAGGFIDPLYSNGLDILAWESDFFIDIITRDIKNELSQNELSELVEKTNSLVSRSYEYYAGLILGNYSCLGSCEIFSLKYLFEFYSYYLHRLWPYASKFGISDLYSDNNDLKIVLDCITSNFLELAREFQKQGLFYRKNKGWRQYSGRGIYFEDRMHVPLDKTMSKAKYFMFLDLIRFVLLSQAELLLKRKDLSCDSGLAESITFDNIISYSKSYGKSTFMDYIEDSIEKNEKGLSSSEYWHKWLNKVFNGYNSLHSGLNFAKLKTGMPFMFRYPVSDISYHDDAIGNIVKIFHNAEENPGKFLKELNYAEHEDYIKPFLVEAASVSLLKQGFSMKNAIKYLFPKSGEEYLQLIITGCGFGCYGVNPETVFANSHSFDKYMDWFMDGYGCKIGLEKFFNDKEIHFPSITHRSPILKGLGRSVTFMPNEKNTEEKYEKYFEFFELYPEDRENYYYGVGFSLAFTKNPFELSKFLSSYKNIFSGKNVNFVKKGVEAAVLYKASLQPSLYRPMLISLGHKNLKLMGHKKYRLQALMA
ncbi:MAG: tryptophan 7-halogenase [Nanoarchaeota archaeon]|nr:tryptophan 7-halogenase [Nanoarchaeota archaeon]